MDTRNVSGFSKGKIRTTANASGSRRTEVLETTDISDSNVGKLWGTSNSSGSSKGEVWCRPNVSGSRGLESLHTHSVSGNGGTEVLQTQCEDTELRKTTAEGSRHTSNTAQQPSADGDQTSIMKERFEIMKEMDNKKTKEMFEMIKEIDKKTKEMFDMMKEMNNQNMKEIFEMMKKMDNKIITVSDTVHTLLHLPDGHNRAIPGRVIQIQHWEKEENEMLREKVKKLEARIQELLAKAMATHQFSEDINDPFHLSAVLERYEMLRLQEWEKIRSSLPYRWTYEEGSRIIRKLFDACEKDIQQRTDYILEVLDVPLQNNALIKAMMQDILKLFRQHYHQNSMVYKKIVQDAAIHIGTENEKQFLLQCCQIYCLLLLQDPPIKADWKMNRRYLEHVDKKDEVHWKNPSLLWPIMRCGEEIIVKGVVWDQKRMA